MSPAQIVITSNTLNFGGAEQQRVALANGLADTGFMVEIRVIQSVGPLARHVKGQVRIRNLSGSVAKNIQVALGQKGGTLITGTTTTELAHALLCRLVGTKPSWIVATHNPTSGVDSTYPWHIRKLVSMADRIITLSEVQTESLITQDRFRSEIVRIIPNGISTERFLTLSKRPKTPGLMRLGFIGRLAHQKGIDILLDALLAWDQPEWSLRVSGEGDELYLFSEPKYESIRARIDLVGALDPELTLDRVDALLVPSRNEAFPLVVLEALVAGVPLLVTKVGANSEILADFSCPIVEPNSVQSLLAGLNKLVANFNELAIEAESARTLAANLHSMELMVQRYISVIEELQ